MLRKLAIRGSLAGRLAAAIVLAAVVSLALLLNLSQAPAPSGSPSPTATAEETASPSLAPTSTPSPQTVPPVAGFTTGAPTTASATWNSLTWTKLDAGDTLSLVRRVIRWSGGFVALGETPQPEGDVRTQVWVSADGQHWQALDRGVFGDSTMVVSVVEADRVLVALTVTPSPLCAGSVADCTAVLGPEGSWTSSDAVHWTYHIGPDLVPTATGPDTQPSPPLLLVGGPDGMLAATRNGPDPTVSTSGPSFALSSDGISWRTVTPEGIPSGFALGGLWGRSDGYVAVGAVPTRQDHFAGVVLWSPDGQHWTATHGAQLARAGTVLAATSPSWTIGSIEAAIRGAIAVGGVAAAPGAILWWQSSDGRQWRSLSDYPPLGAWLGPGEGQGGYPDGDLGGDGDRLVALRLRGTAAAWVSFDGASWSPITMSGAVPTGYDGPGAGTITVLPGGLLFTDTSGAAWYGAAAAR